MWHIQEQELSPCGVQEGLALFYSLKFPSHAGAAANICSAGSLMLLHAFRAACTPEGCHCWSRSVPLLPHFTTLEFKLTGRIWAFGSPAAAGAETKPQQTALLQP